MVQKHTFSLLSFIRNNRKNANGDSAVYLRITIDGKPVTSYTFKQDYYFMMGDNRDNSLDSRFWGFVPEDHIVGKAVFVWMSLDPNPANIWNKIRWNRLFRTID